MREFLKLTDYSTGRAIYVNVDELIHFSNREQSDATDIVITTHVERLHVKEPPEKIVEMLQNGAANVRAPGPQRD